jgi:hypothetical protein
MVGRLWNILPRPSYYFTQLSNFSLDTRVFLCYYYPNMRAYKIKTVVDFIVENKSYQKVCQIKLANGEFRYKATILSDSDYISECEEYKASDIAEKSNKWVLLDMFTASAIKAMIERVKNPEVANRVSLTSLQAQAFGR